MRRALPVWWKLAVVLVVVGGVVAFLLTGSEASEAFVYSKKVHEVLAKPAAFAGQTLRVEGLLVNGSVRFRESPCEWRFVLQEQDKTMPVRFPECVVPDTFRDGMGISVTVQGKLLASGTFLADQVIPRCPSKYEMKQRQQKGEKAPHELSPLSVKPPVAGP